MQLRTLIKPPEQREAVEMRELRYGYLPKRFLWHGRLYTVEEVVGNESRHVSEAKVCFRVRCAEGSFNLYQDVRLNAWEVAKTENSNRLKLEPKH